VKSESPVSFVSGLLSATMLPDSRALRMCYDRLNSLLRTLQITDIDEYTPLSLVTNFATLVSTYDKGFQVIMEPYDSRTPAISDPLLQLCCLDASLAIKPVFERFRNVIITSGTLSPLDMFARILAFSPKVRESLPMSMTRNCICPLIVSKGSDQVPITSRYESRTDTAVAQNYGRLLVEIASVVPDGVVGFFTSYAYMEDIVSQWDTMGVLKDVLSHKLIFIETKDVMETSLALDSFKKACDCGRGAVFFSVARGKVAEGIDFDNHYGRCVILFGIPFQYTLSLVLKARMEYLRKTFNLSESEYLTFDAIRQASQCVGRVIRSKSDYGVMIFADERYSRIDKRRKLPQWIIQYIDNSHLSLSTDQAVQIVQDFLKKMAQPRLKENDLGITMLDERQIAAKNREHMRT